MSSDLRTVLEYIRARDPVHCNKLTANLAHYGEAHEALAEHFLQRYQRHLQASGLDLRFGVDCYLRMLVDMLDERVRFLRSGRYRHSSFAEVEQCVYANPEVMTYHMHGLALAQFLWFDQYERLLFFRNNLNRHLPQAGKYLELGGGHGLYMSQALELLPPTCSFDLVDISTSSLQLARGLIDDSRVSYHQSDIFEFSAAAAYDFITLGEVLEHVEHPRQLLQRIGELLTADGVCYLTTPINAPMIDHIHLFNHADEIRELISQAGFTLLEEKLVISERISEEQARRFKVPVMFAAFIRKT